MKTLKLILGWLVIAVGIGNYIFGVVSIFSPGMVGEANDYVLQGLNNLRDSYSDDLPSLLFLIFKVDWELTASCIAFGALTLLIPLSSVTRFRDVFVASIGTSIAAARLAKAERTKTVPAGLSKGSVDRYLPSRFARSILLIGVLLLIYAVFMDVSVDTGYGQRVINFDLMSRREIIIAIGGIAFLAGVIAIYVGRSVQKKMSQVNDFDASDWKNCPQCAENVRAAAVKCRYCAAELENEHV